MSSKRPARGSSPRPGAARRASPRTAGPTPLDFRLLFESAPGLYLVLTPDLTIVGASDAYLAATMTERAQILGRGLFDVFPDNPDDVDATGVANLRASLGRVLSERRSDTMAVQKYDIRRPESEGGGFEERYWSPVNSPVFAADGAIAYIIHRVEDVTEFVRLKQQGTSMEAEIFRRAQQIQEANRRLRELQGHLEQRVLERTAELQRMNDELQRQIAERQRTEAALEQTESQLRQAQKLEAVGRLAAGIAHDFNNILTAIIGYGEIGKMKLGAGHPVYGNLVEICKAGQRAATLTRQLLAFSRQQVLQPRPLDLNAVLEDLDPMLRRLLGEHIELATRPAASLGRVLADRGQVEQVIMNLAVNAGDAMPRGGRLTIETSELLLDEKYTARRGDVKPGRYAMLAVSDDGTGMDAATIARIFEPFFTTKEQGRGTGLGLSTVYGIVKQSGGSIDVYSEPGQGTTFKIYLPRAEGKEEAPEESRRVVEVPTAGWETVLLVEDEPGVRGVTRQILFLRGYEVLEACNGHEALRALEQRDGPVHLMITDIVMPGMGVSELMARAVALRPDLRILCVSGYAEQAILHKALVVDRTPFLQKPFAPETLLQKVRQVLDGDRTDAAA